jgi:NitT/TauT family transport system permease protein
VLFLIVWEYGAQFVDPMFLASPSAIGKAFVEMMRTGELVKGFISTMYPFVIGMTITIVGGIALGILMAELPWVEYILDPFVNALYAIPRIALVPLIILWLGLDTTGKVAILVSIAIFPVIINTFAGIKDVRGAMIEIGRAYGATRTQLFLKIVLPATVPFIMTGIRLAVGLGIIGIIVGEFFTAVSGLGGLIVNYSNLFVTPKLFVPIIVVGIMGVILTEIVLWFERRLSRWRQSEKDRF